MPPTFTAGYRDGMDNTEQATGPTGATVHQRSATVIVKFEAADKKGMTLDELDTIVRRARAMELPGDTRVYATSVGAWAQTLRKLEIR